jgi:DNA-binding MarR family transcriptional regulator
MVRIRRSQTRRTLARVVERETGERIDLASAFVIDALEEAREAGGRLATVGGVAERLAIDPSRASRMAAAAIAAGHVRRVASQSDGRQIRLELTDQGEELAATLRGFRTALFARVMADWSDRDCREFARLLTKFTEPGDLADD